MFKLILSMVVFLNILNAASSSGDDDDVLLLTQISGQGHTCCITPLASQKDGLSVGPKAEWVKAQFELTDGEKTLKLKDNIFCPWTMGEGGFIACQSSSSKWNCLKVFPEIGEEMRKILGVSHDDVIFFELGVLCYDHRLIIKDNAIMVRKSAAAEIRKKIFNESVFLPEIGAPKVLIRVSNI